MMKLGYLYIIFLFSFVSATPYGYGTKGGATARASATSSAFGSQSGLPLSVPIGSGFSGSFSESSSSSFASSSSSSFNVGGASSFNGNKLGFNGGTGCGPSGCQNLVPPLSVPSSDAIGISETSSGINTAATALGGLQISECGSQNCHQNDAYKSTDITSTGHLADTQHSGCSYGACHQSGTNIISGEQSASLSSTEQKQSDSNTDSTFGVKSGTSFLNKDDKSLSFGCKDSKCSTLGTNHKPHYTESEKKPLNYVASQKCSSGQCTSNTEKETIYVPHFNDNDIPAKTYQPELVDHSEHNLQDKNWTSKPKADCIFAGCGTLQSNVNTALGFSNTHDHYYPSNCKTPDCTSHETSSSSAINGNIGYKKPVTFLQTPKGTTCFSSNCQQESQTGETKPSSYDVPIHGGINTLQVDSLSSTHKQPSLSFNVPSSEGSSSNCKTFNCGGQSFRHPGSIGTPSTQQFDSMYSSIGLSSSNTPGAGPSGVYRPNGFNIGITSDKPAVISQGGYHISTKPNVQHSTKTIPNYGLNGAGSIKPYDLTGFGVTQSTLFAKPEVVTKPSKEEAYTGGFGGPPGLLKPYEFNYNSNFATPSIKHPTTSKPNVKPFDQKLPTYTGGFGVSSSLLEPNEFDNVKPINTNSQSAVTHTGLPDIKKPDVFRKPTNQNFPTYTGSFNGLTQTVEPNNLNTDHSSDTANPAPFLHTGLNSYSKPSVDVKPLDHNVPTHTIGFSGPSGLLKPNEFDVAKPSVNVNTETVAHTGISHVEKPIALDKPINQNYPTYTVGLSGPTGAPHTNEFNVPHHTSSTGVFSHTEYPFSKPSANVEPSNQKLPAHTGSFSGPPESLKPNDLISGHSLIETNAAAVGHSDHHSIKKPVTVDVKIPNEKLPTHTVGFSKPSGLLKPSQLGVNNVAVSHTESSAIANPITITKPSHQKLTTQTGVKPIEFHTGQSSVSANSDAILQTEHQVLNEPSADIKPAIEELPTYTSGFGGLTGLLKPNEFDAAKASANANSAADVSTGHPDVIKPDTSVKPLDQNLPTYSGGFGGPSGLLKPNEFDVAKPSVNVNTETVADTGISHVEKPIALDKPINQNYPTYTVGLSGPTGAPHTNEFNVPHHTSSTGVFSHTEYPFSKPSANVEPSNQKLPAHTGIFSGPPESLKPSEFISGHSLIDTNAPAVGHSDHHSIKKPVTVDVKIPNEKLPTHTVGFSKPSGLLKPSQLGVNNVAVSHTESSAIANPITITKPSDQKLTTQTGVKPIEFHTGQSSVSANSDAILQTEHQVLNEPSADIKPAIEELPTYTSGFGGLTGLLKPNEFDAAKASSNANSAADVSTGHPDVIKPETSVKPLDQNLPTYSGGFGGPSGLLNPNEFDVAKPSVNVNTETVAHTGISHVEKPIALDKPINQNYPTYTVGLSGPTGAPHTNEFNVPHHTSSTGVFSHTEYPFSKPSANVEPSNQKLPAHTGSFSGPPESLKPSEFISGHSLINTNAAAVGHSDHHSIKKPVTVDVKIPNEKLPTHTVGFSKPSGLLKPSQLGVNNVAVSHTESSAIANPITITKPSDQKLTTETGVKPIELHTGQSSVSANSDAILQTEHQVFNKPSADIKPAIEELPTYTSGFGGLSGLLKPNEFDAAKASANANSAADVPTGHPDFIKPITFGKPSNQNIPTFTGGFGGPPETHKPNVFVSGHTTDTNAADVLPANKTLPSNPDGFGKPPEEKCNDLNTVTPSTNVNVAPYLQTQQTLSTSSVAKSEAVAYTGGFGGPPGLLKPNDGGRLSSTVHYGKVPFDSQFGDKYGKIHSDIESTSVNIDKTNIDSSISGFGTTGANVGSTSLDFTKGGLENIDSTTGISSDHKEIGVINKGNKLPYSKKTNDAASESVADIGFPPIAIAQASASAGATTSDTSTAFSSSDDSQDKFTQVFDNKQKSTGGCAGGCRGGAYGGGTNFGFGGSLSKPGYFGGWNSGLRGASASAQSTAGALSGARAFSVGGSYASSSASAHASSGYPTKGGYGK